MYQAALELLPRLKGLPLLCLGDMMLDRYIYGQATRISPEAPVPVVRVGRRLVMPGGAGNVVKNLGALEALPLAVGVVGDDAPAREMSALFADAGWLPPILITDPERPTSVKTRIVAGIQQVVRFDEEDNAPVGPRTAELFLAAVRRHLPEVKAVALSDYGKGLLTCDITREVIRLAREAGRPVVVDPKGGDYSKYAGAALITPNRAELSEAVGREVREPAELAEAGRELMRRCRFDNLLITRSEDGMMLLSGDRPEPTVLPSKAREVFDVSGAGDTVVAVMTAALGAGADLEIGAGLATLAAGVVVGKVGTAVASPSEILAFGRE